MNCFEQLYREIRSRFGGKNDEEAFAEMSEPLGSIMKECSEALKMYYMINSLEEANEQELIADEAADIVIYLDILCQRAGLDLSAAIVNKFNKGSRRIGSLIEIY
jgi:NTP pyrophosphatase (non-canonical NTP hydrolase)